VSIFDPTSGMNPLPWLQEKTLRALEEAARLAGLHFKVDVVVNHRREVVGLFAGDVVAEHRTGVKLATQVYRTETVKERFSPK